MKNSTGLKRILVIIVILFVFIFSGCQLSPEIAYDNFITDLDVLYRFEEIAFNVEFGRYSSIFQSDIRYLIRDLETFNITSTRAERINDTFIESAERFLKASEYYLEGEEDSGEYYLTDAETKYNEALTAFYDFIIQ